MKKLTTTNSKTDKLIDELKHWTTNSLVGA